VISEVSHRIASAKKLPSAAATPPQHEPGLLRDIVEKGAGVVSAIAKVPGGLISGLTVGTYQGARKGANADFTIRPESVALGVVTANAVQGVAQGLISGFLLLGPAGALAGTVKELGESGVGLYLFVKGGSAKAVGEQMAAAIDQKVQPGEGPFEGGIHGAIAGTVSGVKAGAKTGFQEGQAAASGVIEGLKEIPREFSGAQELKGPFWKRALSLASGVASAAFAAPMGLALSLMKGTNGDKTVSTGVRYAASTASGALMGCLAGTVMGPVGMLVGAGVGAVVGMLGPTSKKGFEAGLESSLARARADDGDMGSEVGNNRRDLVQTIVTGTVSGARQGWDAGAGLLPH
jgi:hypothetical protein